jgi:hypothetical protein
LLPAEHADISTPRIYEVVTHRPCVADGGCSYLRALSTIEHIAGFEHTARNYAAAAERCQRNGCWAASANDTHGAALHAAAPIPPLEAQNGDLYAGARPRGQAIPFVRSQLLEVVTDSQGNYVERRPVKLDTLPERDDPLGYLYQYWRSLRSEAGCQFSNIDTIHLVRAGIIGKLDIIDVAQAIRASSASSSRAMPCRWGATRSCGTSPSGSMPTLPCATIMWCGSLACRASIASGAASAKPVIIGRASSCRSLMKAAA